MMPWLHVLQSCEFDSVCVKKQKRIHKYITLNHEFFLVNLYLFSVPGCSIVVEKTCTCVQCPQVISNSSEII